MTSRRCPKASSAGLEVLGGALDIAAADLRAAGRRERRSYCWAAARQRGDGAAVHFRGPPLARWQSRHWPFCSTLHFKIAVMHRHCLLLACAMCMRENIQEDTMCGTPIGLQVCRHPHSPVLLDLRHATTALQRCCQLQQAAATARAAHSTLCPPSFQCFTWHSRKQYACRHHESRDARKTPLAGPPAAAATKLTLLTKPVTHLLAALAALFPPQCAPSARRTMAWHVAGPLRAA